MTQTLIEQFFRNSIQRRDIFNDGGFLIPAKFVDDILFQRKRVRRASKGFRQHARKLKRAGKWRGGPVNTIKKVERI